MSEIELIIKIPEEVYKSIINGKNYISYQEYMEEAIKNGKLLTKGHGRLKDENEIKQMIEDAKVKNESSKNFAENIIRFAPTIIESDKESEE